ncbi:unnamed protein product [Rhodiola kirilowii]
MKFRRCFFCCHKTKEADSLSRESELKPRNLNGVEKLLGYEFKDKTLLEKAFTHASYTDVICESYERLEYVGDAVLNMLVARAFYIWYPKLSPGLLTQLRAANVDTEKLARVAVKHGLYAYLRHQKGNQIEDQIQEFREEMELHPLHSMGLIKPPKVLADIVESLVGAIFMDCGFSPDKLWPIVKSLLEPIIYLDTMRSHPKSELQELCQKKGWKIHYKRDLENGVINVFVEDRLVGKASFSSPNIKKDVATNHAAKNALIHLKTVTFLGLD